MTDASRYRPDIPPPPPTMFTRRRLLALGSGLAAAAAAGRALPALAAKAPSLHLLAPAAYGDGALLAALGAAAKGTVDLAPLATDDDALAPLAPLLPGATAAQQAARAGLVVTAHPWMQGVLWPEGVIEPLGKDGAPPPTAFELRPDLSPSLAQLETGLEGRYLLGRALRFEIAGVGLDERRVSAPALEDIGLGLLDDPVLAGRIGLVADHRALLAMAMLYCGLNPFRLQLESEIRRFEAGVHRLAERVALVAPSGVDAARALADGRIDIALPLGLGDLAPARLAGAGHLVLALPGRGPIAGKAAFYWVEVMAMTSQCPQAAAARDLLDALHGPALTGAIARMDGLCPAVGLLAPAQPPILSPAEQDALQMARWPDLLGRCAAMALVPERRRLQAVLDQALAAHH